MPFLRLLFPDSGQLQRVLLDQVLKNDSEPLVQESSVLGHVDGERPAVGELENGVPKLLLWVCVVLGVGVE